MNIRRQWRAGERIDLELPFAGAGKQRCSTQVVTTT